MDKKILKIDDKLKSILINNIDIDKIIVFNKLPFRKQNLKNFMHISCTNDYL